MQNVIIVVTVTALIGMHNIFHIRKTGFRRETNHDSLLPSSVGFASTLMLDFVVSQLLAICHRFRVQRHDSSAATTRPPMTSIVLSLSCRNLRLHAIRVRYPNTA